MPAKRAATKRIWRDPDDAPELSDEMLARAELRIGERIVRHGRPKSSAAKLQVTLRLDRDVVEHFRSEGPGWQSRMNATLRRSVKRARG